jgi:MFS superfamily sulfate permease-like transporter
MTEMMWSLLPWLTFMTATPLANLWAGLAAGLAVAIVVLARAIAHRKVRMLE